MVQHLEILFVEFCCHHYRVLLQLLLRLKEFSMSSQQYPVQSSNAAALAHAALQELGYSAAEINAALKGVSPTATTEEMVRYALRAMVLKG